MKNGAAVPRHESPLCLYMALQKRSPADTSTIHALGQIGGAVLEGDGSVSARKDDHMKTIKLVAAALLIAGSGVTLHMAQAQQLGIQRTDLLQHDLDVPGRELVQVRVDFEPGAVAAKHSHPGEEIAYVLKGSLEYQLGDGSPVTLKAGETLFIPAGVAHTAKNVGNGKASELATYIVKKGTPLVVPVK